MNNKGNLAYIGIGSNLGDRQHYLFSAVTKLHEHPELTVDVCSSVYETAPVGLTEQPHFLNMVIEVRTTLPPEQLLHVMLETERSLGRVRDVRWGPRTIDLDLLLYDQVTMRNELLELPHPRIRERAFVLIPLVEILGRPELQDAAALPELEQALRTVDGKEDVQLWAQTSWRSAFGRFAN